MFVWKNNEAIYLLSASDENLKKFMGPYAIQWRQIQKALDKHMTRYNFYGTSGILTRVPMIMGFTNSKRIQRSCRRVDWRF